MRFLFIAAALAGATGVALGAFGAHALKAIVEPAALETWRTAVLYHLVHALALLAVALAWPVLPQRALRLAGALMLAGILLFSGSLYLLVLTGVRVLGAITPVGGAAFIAAWALLAWAGLR